MKLICDNLCKSVDKIEFKLALLSNYRKKRASGKSCVSLRLFFS